MWTIFRIIVLMLFATSTSVLLTRGTKPSMFQGVVAPHVTIATLVADGERYSDTQVRITGQVVPETRFSLFGIGGYQLREATGATVFVFSRGQSIPPIGSTATILGSLKSILQAGSFNYPVFVQE